LVRLLPFYTLLNVETITNCKQKQMPQALAVDEWSLEYEYSDRTPWFRNTCIERRKAEKQ
jgi:hypothetical protein